MCVLLLNLLKSLLVTSPDTPMTQDTMCEIPAAPLRLRVRSSLEHTEDNTPVRPSCACDMHHSVKRRLGEHK